MQAFLLAFAIFSTSLALTYQSGCEQNWFNMCQSNDQCCSGNCFKGENGDWKDGLCKPKQSFVVKDHEGSLKQGCEQNWFNMCQSNDQCCSGNCFKGENGDWKDGLCKPKQSFNF